MITVFTVVLNAYDNLRPPQCIEPGVRYVCFSDEAQNCPPWEVIPAPQPYSDASRNSRIPKILPHLLLDAEYSIYHDACLQLTARPSDLIAKYLSGADVALYRHPCRTSVYEELECCERLGIGAGPEMRAQVERYRAHELGQGLYAGGVVIRRHTDLCALFNETWWREYRDGCARDQFALAFAVHSVGLKAGVIDADILQDAGRFQFCFHAAFEHLSDNPSFAEQRARRDERLARLEELIG
jgi:hypothetical protein